jgi:hypothetical protein
LLSLLCGRKAAASRFHIVLQMPRIIRGRNRASDRWMGRDPFQKKLCPRSTIEFCRPIGQRFFSYASEEIAAPEGPIHEHGNAPFFRQRQKALLGFAFRD